ncbi:MAG TPA: hypothetical protein VGF18_09140 [Candidatus Tumulicola sp.]
MSRHTIAFAIFIVLTGCSGAMQSPSSTAGSAAGSAARHPQPSTSISARGHMTVHRDLARSHVSKIATASKLLYVSDASTGDVQIFSYPTGAPVGTITGFNEPQGECVDGKGDVFVTNTQASQILEFAHGGTTPIATFSDAGQFPVACAISSLTGELAVSNAFDSSFSTASVSIFNPTTKKAKTYPNPLFWESYFLSFDNENNVYVDGLVTGGYFTFGLAELHKGTWNYTAVPLDTTVNWPGNVVWSKENLAVGDQEYTPDSSAVYQVQLAASSGSVVGTTVLDTSCDVVQFYILNSLLSAPDACKPGVGEYAYPAGGGRKKLVKTGLVNPVGAVVSVAKVTTP